MRNVRNFLFLAAMSTLAALPALSASIIFQDNFSSDTGGLAKTTLTNFNVINGTNIDIGSFGALCSPTCLDSQGSGGNSSGDIETKSSFSLGPGFNYTFHYTIDNPTAASVLLSIGTFSQLLNSTTAGAYDITFTLPSIQTAKIRLTDQGPADNVGAYIGNLVLSSDPVSGVPEPSTIWMGALGAAALAVAKIRQRA